MSRLHGKVAGQLDFDGRVMAAIMWREAFERVEMHPTRWSWEQVAKKWERVHHVDEAVTVLGWLCPSCREPVQSVDELRWQHDWDPDVPGTRPEGGWCENAWERFTPRWCAMLDEADTLFEAWLDDQYEAGLA